LNNYKNSTFCPLLFQHLATHPHGGVTHCCVADHRNAISSAKDENNYYYNLNTDSIYNTFNSASFRKARLQVLENRKPKACLRCFDEESKNIKSKRLEEIGNYPDFTLDFAKKITDDEGYIKDLDFDFVELRLGNTCNVSCRTCNPVSSSKWLEDYDLLQKHLSFKLTNYNSLLSFKWPEQDGFWDDLLKYCKNVKTFYINGGEPTLIKQHFVFLEKLANLGMTNIKLWYNINMTNLNENILEIWRKFDKVKISCSIDDLYERNEYIRHPTKWDTVLENFNKLKKEKFEIDVTQTVSFMNYSNLDNFYDFFHNKNNVWVHHNYVYDPAILSPNVLPLKYRDSIHQKFKAKFPDWKIKELTSLFSKPDNIDDWEKAKEYTLYLDKFRNQSIFNFLPEFKTLL